MFVRTSFPVLAMSRRRLATFVCLLAAACSGGSGDGPVPAELQSRVFRFADGRVFDEALEGAPVELAFGRVRDSGRGVFVLVVPTVVGTDTGPARIEGSFRTQPCTFEVRSSSFDEADFPALQPGERLRMATCTLDPRTSCLTLVRLGRGGGAVESTPPEPRPSLVVVLTDDQRWDSLAAMPLMTDRLADRSVSFTSAYQTTPVCGPSRASLLAGGFYAHDTGVRTHGRLNGGIDRFDDTRTLATAFQRVGYRTGFVGKYVNGYASVAPYVPPGWSSFLAMRSEDPWSSFSVVKGASTALPSRGKGVGPIEQYVTDFQAERALQFLEQHGDYPFLLVFSPNAPHRPATPAPQDEALFGSFVYRDRAYGERDLSDKPSWVQEAPPFNEAAHDAFRRDQLRSLQAVDRAVVALVDAVERLGKLDETAFFFSSDNGLQWGEHGLTGKGKPYEESVRVPLIVSLPGVAPRTDDRLVAADLDLPATLLDLARVSAPTGGRSLRPLLDGSERGWRDELVLESAGQAAGEGVSWSGLRVRRGLQEWKYVEYATGERELYDLVADPFEEENAHAVHPTVVAELAELLAPLQGLTILDDELPPASVGRAYAFELERWGGEAPFVWSVVDGTLPEGLRLEEATGRIVGTPFAVGERTFVVEVTSQAPALHSGRPQRFARELVLSVGR